jgi:hypothetical protein
MTHAQRTDLIDDLELMTDVNRDQAAQVLKRIEKLATDPKGGLVDSETVEDIRRGVRNRTSPRTGGTEWT